MYQCSVVHGVESVEIHEALRLLRSALSLGADVNSACWVESGGQYYPPLEYVCVLHRCRLQGNWVYGVLDGMLKRGARPKFCEFQGEEMRQYAQNLLADCTRVSSANKSLA